MTLHSGDTLVQRAAQLAVEVGHPVYDCLYLACAEATASALVTADQRLADKAAGRWPNIGVRYIGTPAVAARLDAAATSLVISRKKVDELIAAYEVFAATKDHVTTAVHSGAEGLKIMSAEDMDRYLETPAYMRLLSLIDALTDEERIDLAALGWFGAKVMGDEWRRNLEHASRMSGELTPHYLAGYGQHWRDGYAHLMRMTQVRERAPVYA